ncbi:MAG: hypothetical protein SXQ77_01710, partial [Halobacteria archaeon]|nr:hypothetical protein [Halobacteria archaeon]
LTKQLNKREDNCLVRMSDGLPEPPEGVPNYIADGLQRQDVESLEEVIEYSNELIEYLEQPPDEEIETKDGEKIIEKTQKKGYTRVVKKQQCGKENCNKCPHGPYVWHVKRRGDKLDWDYQGSVDD